MLESSYPFFIQVVREYVTKVDDLVKDKEKREKDRKPEQAAFTAPETVIQAIPQIAYYDPNQQQQQFQQVPQQGFQQPNQFQPATGYFPNQF